MNSVSKFQIKDNTLFELQELTNRHIVRNMDREIRSLVHEVKRLHEKYPDENHGVRIIDD